MRERPSLQSFSRRNILGWGAASALLVPQSTFAQSVRETPPASPDAASSSIAAETDAFKHMTVPVMINGKGPFRFVVDTGADRSVIADSVAESLGLTRHGNVVVEGVVRKVPAETVRVHNMTFGPVELEDLVLPVLPRIWLDADGYLGLDAIDRYSVTLDFNRRELSVDTPRSIWSFENSWYAGMPVEAVGSHGHLRMVNCRVDSVRTSTFLDTGAAISVGNRPLFDALRADNPDYFLKSTAVKISGVTGGSIDGRVMDFNRVRIQGLDLTNGSIVIADLRIFDVWGLADRPALLIGMNFLRQFERVTIDFGRKEYRFKVSRLFVAQRG